MHQNIRFNFLFNLRDDGFFLESDRKFQNHFRPYDTKGDFFFLFFWSLTGFFFQKKLVRQVIKLEWP